MDTHCTDDNDAQRAWQYFHEHPSTCVFVCAAHRLARAECMQIQSRSTRRLHQNKSSRRVSKETCAEATLIAIEPWSLTPSVARQAHDVGRHRGDAMQSVTTHLHEGVVLAYPRQTALRRKRHENRSVECAVERQRGVFERRLPLPDPCAVGGTVRCSAVQCRVMQCVCEMKVSMRL
jgi:hypothetical protein